MQLQRKLAGSQSLWASQETLPQAPHLPAHPQPRAQPVYLCQDRLSAASTGWWYPAGSAAVLAVQLLLSSAS